MLMANKMLVHASADTALQVAYFCEELYVCAFWLLQRNLLTA